MKAEIYLLLMVFDEVMTSTKEEEGIYWLKKTRDDGLNIILVFYINKNYAKVMISNKNNMDIASIGLDNCSEINILDEKRCCLEILHANGKGRAFLCLTASPILSYDE